MLTSRTLTISLNQLLPTTANEGSHVIHATDAVRSPPADQLFAILDACDEPLVLNLVKSLGSRAMSLYAGVAASRFEDFAPYLVKVDQSLLVWIEKHLAGKPWGMLLVTTASLIDLRKHLRKFLMVELEGRSVYFRFYDPRILPPFLQSTAQEDLKEFFGPIERFIVPTKEADKFLDLSCVAHSQMAAANV